MSVQSEDAHAERRYDFGPPEKIKAPKSLKDPVLVAMAEKLKTPAGKATHRKRACSVEPVPFGFAQGRLLGSSLRPIRPVRLRSGTLGYQDLVKASDVVIGKLGYGTLSACVAAKTKLLYPPRTGFREDELLVAGAHRFSCPQEIPVSDFEAGDWGRHLDALCSKPDTSETLATQGAEACAETLIGFL